MSNNISGKVVVITGASSGLGEATARHLSQLDAKVVLAARHYPVVFASGPVHVSIEHVRRMESAVCAVHHVTERVTANGPDGPRTAFVMATNVFLRMPQGWRMVAHHASPGMAEDLPDITEPRGVLH